MLTKLYASCLGALVLLLLLGATTFKMSVNDREKDNLRGPVKTVTEKEYRPVLVNGKIEKGNLLFTNISSYTVDGRLIKKSFQSQDGELIQLDTFIYNNQKQLIRSDHTSSLKQHKWITYRYVEDSLLVRSTHEYANGRKMDKIQLFNAEGYLVAFYEVHPWKPDAESNKEYYRYDSHGRKTETHIDYFDKGTIKIFYEYDANGNLTDEREFFSDSAPGRFRKSEYNEHNHVVKHVVTQDGNILTTEITSYGTYDAKGNYLQYSMFVDGMPYTIRDRVISYY